MFICLQTFRASAETHQMAKFDEGIKANPSIADKSVFKTFTNAVHGFAAARADVSVLRSPEGSADGRQLAQGRPGQGGLRRGIHGVDQVLQERVRLDGYEIPSTPSLSGRARHGQRATLSGIKRAPPRSRPSATPIVGVKRHSKLPLAHVPDIGTNLNLPPSLIASRSLAGSVNAAKATAVSS